MSTPPLSSASRVHAETIVKILGRRLGELDPKVRRRIERERDAATLERWYEEAVAVDGEDDASRLAEEILAAPLPEPPAPRPQGPILGIVAAIVALGLVAGGALAYRTYVARERARFINTACGKGTLALVGRLSRPMQITLFVTPGSAKVDRFAQEVGAMMLDLAQRSQGKLVYEVVPVVGDAERSRAKDMGLQETMFSDGEGGLHHGFLGMAFNYGSERENIPIFSPEQSQGIPFWVVSKMREVRARADNEALRYGVLAGKEEIKLSEPSLIASTGGRPGPSLAGIIEQALPFYKFADVELQGGTAEIDPSLAGLIVTQPGADYTDEELRRIDQFLMRGDKALMVFASAVNVKRSDASMKAVLDLHGLEHLLAGYGVHVEKDAIFDAGSPVLVRVMASGQVAALRASSMPLVSHAEGAALDDQALDDTFVPFFRLEEIPFPFASTLVPHPERQPEARLRVVARSSPKATASTTSPLDVRPTASPPAGDAKRRPIAVAVEGRLHSAFSDRPGAPGPAPRESRVLVVSSSQFLVNPFARAGNPPPASPSSFMMGAVGGDEDLMMISQPYAQQYLTSTILAFKNTLDWASSDDATTACSALLAPVKTKD